jgi:flavin prenyltransferase
VDRVYRTPFKIISVPVIVLPDDGLSRPYSGSGMEHVVVGICGASGVILGLKTIGALCRLGLHVDAIVTVAARRTAAEEISFPAAEDDDIRRALPDIDQRLLSFHAIDDIGAPPASGTFAARGMIIAPCSMATLAAVSLGLSDNLLRRAADVTIKEGRRLLMVPREMPLSSIHLGHMYALSQAGAIIMPPQPCWYQKPESIEDVENTIVDRILDRFGLPSCIQRWT